MEMEVEIRAGSQSADLARIPNLEKLRNNNIPDHHRPDRRWPVQSTTAVPTWYVGALNRYRARSLKTSVQKSQYRKRCTIATFAFRAPIAKVQ